MGWVAIDGGVVLYLIKFIYLYVKPNLSLTLNTYSIELVLLLLYSMTLMKPQILISLMSAPTKIKE